MSHNISENSIHNITLCGNRRQLNYAPGISGFISTLCKAGFTVKVESNFLAWLRQHADLPEDIPADTPPFQGADVIISLGGDGTFLRTARKTGRSGIPILGVNTGHLGFLAHYTLSDTETLIRMLLCGSFTTEERDLLKVDCPSMPSHIYPYALNEVALLKEDTSSMISVRMMLDNFFLADYLADGVVISTPTGSTAYSLSNGGPLLQPTLSCMVISPIAPHTLTLRPLVVGADSVIDAFTTSRASHFRISIDGSSFTVPCSENVTIRKADYKVKIMRSINDNFASTLRNKLLWGRR